jgi:hypothetical protein
MTMQGPILSELEADVRAVAAASSPAEIFKVLHQASAKAVPRAALFLVRKGQVLGWGSSGYPAALAQRQRAHSAPLSAAWAVDGGRGDAPDFGQGRPTESLALAVRVKGKPIALLVAERTAGETPWFPHALEVLASVARLRLELDLAMRRLEGLTAPEQAAAAVPIAPAVVPTTAPPGPARPAAAPPAVKPAAPATEVVVSTATTAETPELSAARRYARLVATDIRLYNEEAVVLGRRNGDLTKRLGDQLDRGKATFMRRHGSLGPAALELLHEAYVQVLAAGDAKLLPATVLD